MLCHLEYQISPKYLFLGKNDSWIEMLIYQKKTVFPRCNRTSVFISLRSFALSKRLLISTILQLNLFYTFLMRLVFFFFWRIRFCWRFTFRYFRLRWLVFRVSRLVLINFQQFSIVGCDPDAFPHFFFPSFEFNYKDFVKWK